MKKTAILCSLAVLALGALACSLADLPELMPPVSTAMPGDTATPFPTWTSTLQAPPTYTFTPTLIGQRPSPTPTNTPLPTKPLSLLTPTDVPTIIGPSTQPPALPGDSGFDSIALSTDTIYTGDCGENKVEFTVLISKPDKVVDVVLFIRFRDKGTGEETGWDRGTSLEREADAMYKLTVEANQLGSHNNAWVLYQLVGTDDEGKNVARSPVFAESLTMLTCP